MHALVHSFFCCVRSLRDNKFLLKLLVIPFDCPSVGIEVVFVVIAQQDPHRLHIGYVAHQFPVLKRKVGLLAEKKEKVYLGQPVVFCFFRDEPS